MTTLNLKLLTSEQRDAFIRGWQNAGGYMDDADSPSPGALLGRLVIRSKSKAKRSKRWAPTTGASASPKSRRSSLKKQRSWNEVEP